MLAAAAVEAEGFGTIVGPPPIPARNMSGGTLVAPAQNAEHERITRHALACKGGQKPGACFEAQTLLALAGNGASGVAFPKLTYGTVGEPDRDSDPTLFTRLPYGAEYHCDNADYDVVGVKASPPYEPLKAAANNVLVTCRAQIVSDIDGAVAAADRLLNLKGLVVADEVRLLAVPPAPGSPPASTSQPDVPCFARSITMGGLLPTRTFTGAKCEALRSFGHALHTAQDFYSHSTWADKSDPKQKISLTNPPGLGHRGVAPFLNLLNVPKTADAGLITGCFDNGELYMPTDGCLYGGSTFGTMFGGSAGFSRIRHLDLQKDEGTIDPAIGKGITRRGAIGQNFKRAVEAAIAETARKWSEFKAKLKSKLLAAAGASPKAQASANRRFKGIVCAMVHDDPVTDCTGRYAALVIDSSGSNTETDPSDVRKDAADALRVDLASKADAGPDGTFDQLAVVDFDSSARVTYPLGDPGAPEAGQAIRAIDSSGGTFIAGGVTTALTELAKAGPTPDKSAIVLFTDGEDSDQAALVAAIDRATAQGVRVSYGLLAPAGQVSAERPRGPRPETRVKISHAVDPNLKQAILRSGGVFGTIGSAADQRRFTQLVEERGLTAIDDPQGSGGGGPIVLGVEVSGLLDASGSPDVWTYDAGAGEGVKVTLTPAAGVAGRLGVRTADDRSASSAGGAGAAVSLSVKATTAGPISITVTGTPPGLYALKVEPDATAPILAAPRVRRQVPAVVALGPGRVSLARGGRSVRILRRGAAPFIAWRVRARRASSVQLEVKGPRGAHLVLRSSLRRGKSSLVAQLSILGSRRGVWRLELVAANRVIASALVGTR